MSIFNQILQREPPRITVLSAVCGQLVGPWLVTPDDVRAENRAAIEAHAAQEGDDNARGI